MSKVKSITVKVTETEYSKIKQRASKENSSVSDYIRSRIEGDISKSWIKKTTVQKILSRVATTLDKYQEKNNHLTDAIRNELNVLWEKL